VFLVPTMVVGFGVAERIAQGTSLVAILPTAAVGAVTHYQHGNVDLQAAGRIAAAGVPAALVGAALALWLPDRILLGIFGLFLLLAAFRSWPRRRPDPTSTALSIGSGVPARHQSPVTDDEQGSNSM